MLQENKFPIFSSSNTTAHDHGDDTFFTSDKHPFGKALAIIIFSFYFLRLLSIFFRLRHQPFPYIALIALFIQQRWNHDDHDDDVSNNYNHDHQQNQDGVDASVMQTFPVLRYSDVRKLIQNNMLRETAGCAICLTDYIEGDRVRLRLLAKCDHVFHAKCVDRWLTFHVTCPICRTVLTMDSDEDDDKVN